MSNFPLPYSSLKRSTKRIRPRKKAAIRVGKLGIVRVAGPEMDKLRSDCFWRDGGICRECGVRVSDLFEDWHGRKYHMAHIRNKRMYGDTLENVRTLCGDCHRGEHGNPLPRKKKGTQA